MELDNLKEVWAALDDHLKRNAALKESIILEMMKSKAGKLVNRFITFEVISVVVLLFCIPFCVFALDQFRDSYVLMKIITIVFLILMCFFYTPWGIYKIYGLMKFDLSKNMSDNIFCVNRYNLQLKREKKFLFYFLLPALVMLVVLSYASMKVSLSVWVVLICALTVGVLICLFVYKGYDKDIDSILKSLDEIRELKEE